MPVTQPPSAWVERFAPRIPEHGVVLDLACGAGRHARHLLGLGYRVVAVDVDVSRLVDIGPAHRIEVVEADLETKPWPFLGKRFDGIVVTNYLHRPLLPILVESLADGGALIYETFATGHEKLGRPRNPNYLLNPGELRAAFVPPLVLVAYEEATDPAPNAAVRQRICALKEVTRRST